jgi:hypothetical protein
MGDETRTRPVEVPRRDRPATLVPRIEVAELDAQHRRRLPAAVVPRTSDIAIDGSRSQVNSSGSTWPPSRVSS